jgi:hypothetical protein
VTVVEVSRGIEELRLVPIRRSGSMAEEELPVEDAKALAEEAIADKRKEAGDEGEARELYDVPSESSADLAAQQSQE